MNFYVTVQECMGRGTRPTLMSSIRNDYEYAKWTASNTNMPRTRPKFCPRSSDHRGTSVPYHPPCVSFDRPFSSAHRRSQSKPFELIPSSTLYGTISIVKPSCRRKSFFMTFRARIPAVAGPWILGKVRYRRYQRGEKRWSLLDSPARSQSQRHTLQDRMARVSWHRSDPQTTQHPSQRASCYSLHQPYYTHLRQVCNGLSKDCRRTGEEEPLPLATFGLAHTEESGRACTTVRHVTWTSLHSQNSTIHAQPSVGGILWAYARGKVRHESVATGEREGRGKRMEGCRAKVEGAGNLVEGRGRTFLHGKDR